MVIRAASLYQTEPHYRGVRLSAEEYFALPDDGYNYELVDGVMMMSPSPTPEHQAVAMEIAAQLAIYLRDHDVGRVLAETDVSLGRNKAGRDLVYKPEIVFLRTERLAQVRGRIVGAPDLVVEIISPDSRRYDSETKRDDYERHGVHEYWLIDPERDAMTFHRRRGDRFEVIEPDADRFASQAVPGFVLDLALVRKSFKPW